MTTHIKSDRLTQLCDDAITRLDRCISLLKAITAKDTASANAAAWLRGQTRHVPYEGEVLCVPMEPIFAELEALEADEVFGPREQEAHGEDDGMTLTAEAPRTEADCK
jgi:hypothetical protein